MKKTIAALALIATIALTGCQPEAKDENTNGGTNLRAHTIQLPDGRDVTCVRSWGQGAGVTCDWSGAK